MAIFKRLKAYFNKNKELKRYHYGDIIWCYVDEYADFKFEGKHKIRPFIFLAYKKRKIYGYTLTHSIPQKFKLSYQFKNINHDNYAILSCVFIIPRKSYKGYMQKMDDIDAANVGKIVYYMQDDLTIKNDISKKLIIEENDLVSFDNKKYFVLAKDKEQLTLYEITNNKDDISFMTSDKGLIYINSKAVITKTDNVKYVETFKDYLVFLFKEKRKELKSKATIGEGTNLAVGDLFKTNSGTFVVSKIGSDYMEVIKLYSNYPEISRRKLESFKKTGHISKEALNKIIRKASGFKKQFNF